MPEDFPYYRLIHVALDKKSNMAVLSSGLKVPMRPFFGQLAVAPPKDFGRQNSKEPREFGGNLDCKELTAGSTIYLPVWNEGGLFSTGDGHAAQGDGEVNGTAIETALKGTFEFHVRKDLRWRLPRAETATHLITFGLNADLDDAARQALREMIDWITTLTGISKDEAYSLSSFAVDLHVTQTVNNIKGVHAMIDRSILRKRHDACFPIIATGGHYLAWRHASTMLDRQTDRQRMTMNFVDLDRVSLRYGEDDDGTLALHRATLQVERGGIRGGRRPLGLRQIDPDEGGDRAVAGHGRNGHGERPGRGRAAEHRGHGVSESHAAAVADHARQRHAAARDREAALHAAQARAGRL